MTHILLVEDEPAISEPLTLLLQREGYEVTALADGDKALLAFDEGVDLVLLDLMLPGLPGTEVCRKIRAVSTVPIVMLTAKDEEVDIVVGLELGADDYITKPYSSRELIARIRAVLRRRGEDALRTDSDVLESQGLRMDLSAHTLTLHDEPIEIPLREFKLLELLWRNEGTVLTRGQLIDRVWGSDYVGDTKTLDVHIKRIRSRIEVDRKRPERVITVRGLGYRFDG